MGSSIRACARLAALLLLASVCSAQLSGDYIPPNKYIPPPTNKCARDKTIINTRQLRTTITIPGPQTTVTETSIIQRERTQVQPTTVTRTTTVTVSQQVPFVTTSTVTRVVYRTTTVRQGGNVRNVLRTSYVPVIQTVPRTSFVTVPQYVTQDSVTYVTDYNVRTVGTTPVAQTIYVTSTVTVRGPVQLVTSTRIVPKYVQKTLKERDIYVTKYNTEYRTASRVVKSYGPNAQRTATVRVTDVRTSTQTAYITRTVPRVEQVVRTVTDTRTNYITTTKVQPVNVLSTLTVTNTITNTKTIYVTQPVTVTNTRIVPRTEYGPDVVRTIVRPVTRQVNQPGPTVYITSTSVVVSVDTRRVTATHVVSRVLDRTVKVTQPCKTGYDYADQGNPLNI